MKSLRTNKPQFQRRGFTLMEVLLVLAILGVIIGLVVPNLMGQRKKANIGATNLAISNVEQALKLYALDHDGEYPPTASGLEALLTAPGNDPKWKGPYIESGKVPADAWGNPLQYAYPGTHQQGDKPDLWSMGPDKASSTEDDVTNWSAVK